MITTLSEAWTHARTVLNHSLPVSLTLTWTGHSPTPSLSVLSTSSSKAHPLTTFLPNSLSSLSSKTFSIDRCRRLKQNLKAVSPIWSILCAKEIPPGTAWPLFRATRPVDQRVSHGRDSLDRGREDKEQDLLPEVVPRGTYHAPSGEHVIHQA